MASIDKNFDSPDETCPLERDGRVELVNVAAARSERESSSRDGVGRTTSSRSQTDSCEISHLGYVLSGRMRIRKEDGTEGEIGPRDVFSIPPRHDAEVVGGEPCVMVEEDADYAKRH